MYPVVHFEMPYENHDRVAKFYSEVFGWKTQFTGPEMGNYIVVTTADHDVKPDIPRGAIGGGFFKKNPEWPAQVPSVVIGVDNIKAMMKKIDANGGKTLGEPMTIPAVGEYVSFFDTEGNRVSLLQPMM